MDVCGVVSNMFLAQYSSGSAPSAFDRITRFDYALLLNATTHGGQKRKYPALGLCKRLLLLVHMLFTTPAK